jgi:hypothetical protein
VAQTALARGARPILLTAVAAITCSGSTAVKNRGCVTETYAAASATGAPVIDQQTLSVNYYNSLGLCPNNGNYTTGALVAQGIPLAGSLLWQPSGNPVVGRVCPLWTWWAPQRQLSATRGCYGGCGFFVLSSPDEHVDEESPP